MNGEFPSLTSTFINREFEYLRDCTDLDIVSIAIRRPLQASLNQEYKHYTAITKFLRPDALGLIMLTNLLVLFTQPVTYWRALKILLGELKNQSLTRVGRIAFHFLYGVYLGNYLKRHRFDAIHAHFSSAATIALFAHLFSKIPFSLTLHASDDIYSFPVLLECKLKYAHHVITNTRYNEMQINLLTHYRYSKKITVIYNGLELSQFRLARRKDKLIRPMRLVSVGSFTGCKGYPTILKALESLKQDGVEFTYTIIGDGSSAEREMIKRLAAEYQIEQHVTLLGRQSFTRVHQEMERGDVVIMASEIGNLGVRDGLPNVIIEAMLAMRPVVSTYISDIPNIIKPGETGYLFPEKNAEALADILRQIYSHYETTFPLVEAAQQLAKRMFNREENYQVLAGLLVELANSPKATSH
jgi:glycosyltransferase involved in cell wall biosynthesis